MEWDINHGLYAYNGLPLDTKPQLKHIVKLYKTRVEFDLEIISIEDDCFRGRIISIGQKPAIEARGLRIGDEVSFQECHIQRLSCN
jgi:hypothetical protein